MNSTASQQSFFNFNHAIGGVALVMGLCLSQSSDAQQPGQTASPFGLELGQAPCALAKTQLSPAQEQKLDDGDILVESLNPQKLYAGAEKIFARCRESRVIAVQMVASKGGMGNPAAVEAFNNLRKKYKLIEQSAPHLSFQFTVSYMQKPFYSYSVTNSVAE
jgi:hypothetical protein